MSEIEQRIKETIEQRVKSIIGDLLSVREEDIASDSKIDELGADSLDRIEILMHAEEEFDIELDENTAAEFETVGQFLEYVVKVVEGKR